MNLRRNRGFRASGGRIVAKNMGQSILTRASSCVLTRKVFPGAIKGSFRVGRRGPKGLPEVAASLFNPDRIGRAFDFEFSPHVTRRGVDVTPGQAVGELELREGHDGFQGRKQRRRTPPRQHQPREMI